MLNDEQHHIITLAFRLRIEQMKQLKLSYEEYIECGKYYEDLTDARISIVMSKELAKHLDKLFKIELIKACFNPLYKDMYD